MIRKRLFTLPLFLLILLFIRPSYAAPLSEPQDTTIGDGTAASCQTQDAANDLSGAVSLGGTINFNCGPGVVEIVVNTNATDQTVVINGGGKIALSGDNLRQIFFVYDTGNLTLNDVTLQYGDAGSGGALYVDDQASATVNGGFFISNHASSNGGAIYNEGTLTINGSNLGSNATNGNGGGIYNNGGTVIVHNTYFINNQALSGGGITQTNGSLTVDTSAFRSHTVPGVGAGMLIQGGTTHLENVTFSNNQANQGGGIYKSSGTLTMNNLTFNENRADSGGAVYNFGGASTVSNTIFTGSLDEAGVAPSLNCDGPSMTSAGHNIMSDNTCVPNPSSSGDLFATVAFLGVWQVPEHVYFPELNSPAIDYGLNCPDIDQLGKPRPFGNACDVGAVERYWLAYMPVITR